MGRTKKDIKNQLTASFISNEKIIAFYGLTGKTFEEEFSLVSFENTLFEIISYSIYLLEQLFNKHQNEVDEQLYNQKSGRSPWYRFMALQFQYGFALITDTDKYDNTNFTTEQIEASKIIKYAAVVESQDESRMILKIAGEIDDELTPISAEVKASFDAYLMEIRFSGVRITVINYLADKLFLNLRIYRDPLVIDANGMSILQGNYPIQDAINEYMKELPFDGEFIVAHFVDKLQNVSGVKIPHVINIETSWIDPLVDDYGIAIPIDVKAIPVSGYFKVEDFNSIEYVV